jgi:hypothetical protein
MSDASSFGKFVPGFDFLQGLVKNAGAAMPHMGQWVAPTLDPAELEKRIEELKTVQFWLEQNARMLGATIQALEVQRMTLSTLKNMNVQMDQLRDSMKIRIPEPTPPAPADASPEPPSLPHAEATEASDGATASTPPAGVVDPMQWWGALTRQFTELASAAIKDRAPASAPAPSHSAPSAAKRAKATTRKAPARKRAAKRTP